MREISPAIGMSADDFLATRPCKVQILVKGIREEKLSGSRPKPSATLIDKSEILTPEIRRSLLDAIAELVDENLCGRSEMCLQFSTLLHRALTEFGVPSRIALGTAMYFDRGKEIYRWEHAWVRIQSEVVDGNTDMLYENLQAPDSIQARPFWGEIKHIPVGRRLREANGVSPRYDSDVDKVWWPELRQTIQRFRR
ncbi:MAG: lasso peptide biosynthesis protein [Verrucomicrobiota bacterium JB024]|nr:lasso peptide biosynthesis protein [Verrucomicrobiota bacterium JB024]